MRREGNSYLDILAAGGGIHHTVAATREADDDTLLELARGRLAAMRSAMQRLGGDPSKINPLVPVDLVVDHSVQVDAFASGQALEINAKKEFERNYERYEFLHWGKEAFKNF
ncbi:hypothetical protein IIA16_06070, partial [bacterium]|nr:hypothetical protein [bacterium]